MPDLAMRLETSSGPYTNAAGENSYVFDTRIAIGIVDDSFDGIERDGRPAIPVIGGASMYLPEYTYNLHNAPDYYHVDGNMQGMYADNPVPAEALPNAIKELVLAEPGKTHIATFLGRESILSALEEFDHQDDKSRAEYLKRVVLIAVNYGQRQIPG